MASRRVWLLAPVLLAGLAVAYGWTQYAHIPLFFQAPTYRAESQVIIVTPPPMPGSDPAGPAVPAPAESMADEITLMQSPEMARLTLDWLKNHRGGFNNGGYSPSGFLVTPSRGPFTEEDILKAVHVINPTGTHLLTITAESADPKMASDLANATALAFRQWKQDIATKDQMMTTTRLKYEVTQVAKALDQPETTDVFPKPPGMAGSQGVSGERRRLDREIALDLYKRLKTALDTAQLQGGKVSGNVRVVESASPPPAPQQ